MGQDVYVLDLDGATYDLAARDLRKIIGKQSETVAAGTGQDFADSGMVRKGQETFDGGETGTGPLTLCFPIGSLVR